MGHTYASLDELKVFLGDTVAAMGTDGDADLLRKLEGSSASIDEHCRRTGEGFPVSGFGPRIGTNRYDDPPDGVLDLRDDLLSITGSGVTVVQTYGGTPVAFTEGTDFYAEPYDRFPWRTLEINRNVRSAWGATKRGISVPGKWGHAETRVTLGTLAAAITTTTATSCTLSVAASPGQTLLIDDEQLYVSAVSGVTTTVVRGVNGTTAVTHLNAATVARYTYPALVVDTCLALTQRRRKGRDAGLTGNYGGAGPMVVTSNRDTERAFLREMLWSYTMVVI